MAGNPFPNGLNLLKNKMRNHKSTTRRTVVFSLFLIVLFSLGLEGNLDIRKFEQLKKAFDFELINQDSQSVRLNQFQGKHVVLSFIYTRCGMPKMCPLTTRKFAQLQELGRSIGLENRMVLLLVTFDPEFDVPGILKKYANMYNAKTDNWHFLTGTVESVTEVCQEYGIVHEEQEWGQIQHSMITYLIDPEGYIIKFYVGQNWTPEELKKQIMAYQKPNKTEGQK